MDNELYVLLDADNDLLTLDYDGEIMFVVNILSVGYFDKVFLTRKESECQYKNTVYVNQFMLAKDYYNKLDDKRYETAFNILLQHHLNKDNII